MDHGSGHSVSDPTFDRAPAFANCHQLRDAGIEPHPLGRCFPPGSECHCQPVCHGGDNGITCRYRIADSSRDCSHAEPEHDRHPIFRDQRNADAERHDHAFSHITGGHGNTMGDHDGNIQQWTIRESNAIPDSDPDGHANPHTNDQCNANFYGSGNQDTDRNSHGDGNSHADGNANRYGNGDADYHQHRYPHPVTDPQFDTDPHPVTDLHRYADTNANPHPVADPYFDAYAHFHQYPFRNGNSYANQFANRDRNGIEDSYADIHRYRDGESNVDLDADALSLKIGHSNLDHESHPNAKSASLGHGRLDPVTHGKRFSVVYTESNCDSQCYAPHDADADAHPDPNDDSHGDCNTHSDPYANSFAICHPHVDAHRDVDPDTYVDPKTDSDDPG